MKTISPALIDRNLGAWIHLCGLCVHGDTPGAVNLVKQIRELLEAEGIEVKPI